jgi:CAAX protease family protein
MFPAQAASQINGLIGFGGATLIILILTRGRLGYDRYINHGKGNKP